MNTYVARTTPETIMLVINAETTSEADEKYKEYLEEKGFEVANHWVWIQKTEKI